MIFLTVSLNGKGRTTPRFLARNFASWERRFAGPSGTFRVRHEICQRCGEQCNGLTVRGPSLWRACGENACEVGNLWEIWSRRN